MLIWTLILTSWVVLLSLVLHDATKDDSGGSAICIAARNSGLWLKSMMARGRKSLRSVALKAQKLRKRSDYQILQTGMSPASAKKKISSPCEPLTVIDAPPIILEEPVAAPTRRWWNKNKVERASIAPRSLELAIVDAVKKDAPGCESFVGVVVRRTKPKSRLHANWELQGIKFGNADRETAVEALTVIVERLQREFRLAED